MQQAKATAAVCVVEAAVADRGEPVPQPAASSETAATAAEVGISGFIANASHELRTPLTVMRTAMDVVLARSEPTRDELLSMAAEVR